MSKDPTELLTRRYVTVFPDKYQKGYDGSNLVEADWGKVFTLKQALTTRFPSDAHAALYALPNENKLPRFNKSSLSQIKDDTDLPMPEVGSVFIDVDFPDHDSDEYGWHNIEDWPASWVKWRENVEQATEICDELAHAGMYMTRGGMRFFWPLASNVVLSADEAESYIDQFLDYLGDTSLPFDRLSEWNRLFRLPAVNRNGKPTEPRLELSNLQPLDWYPPEQISLSTDVHAGEPKRTEPPKELSEVDAPNKSDFSPVEHTDYYSKIEAGLPLNGPSRHNELVSMTRSIATILETDDPMQIYRLVHETVQSTIEQQTPDDRQFSYDEAWRCCVWAARSQAGQEEQERQQEQSFLEMTAEAMGCEPEQVRRRLIFYTTDSGTYFVWDEDRMEYAVTTANDVQLEPIMAQHCPELSGIESWDSAKTSDILRIFGQSVNDLIFSYTANEHSFDEQKRTLTVPVLKRDPALKAKEHPKVHEWLVRLFGDRAEQGLDWLATFLDFDRMTCALYIHGPPSIGKNLLASGICRLWNTTPTEYEELTDDFQSAMMDSPLLFADEGIPENKFGKSGSQIFRQAIGSSSQKVSRKYMSKADLEGAPRVLIAANDDKAIQTGETLNKDDIEALRQRIGYIHADESPWEYLQEASGSDPVQDLTEKWVDGGRIAEHILWLNKNREVDIGDRFLVEGWESPLTQNLVFEFGEAPKVCRFVAACIRDRRSTKAVEVDQDGVWVNIGRLSEDFNRVLGQGVTAPGHKAMLTVLKTLSEGESKSVQDEVQGDIHTRQYWLLKKKDVIQAADHFEVGVPEDIERAIENRKKESEKHVDENVAAMNSIREDTG